MEITEPEFRGFVGEGYPVEIGEGTQSFAFVSVSKGTLRPTRIGKNCMLLSHCHVSHDCQIGDNVVISAGAKLAGFVNVGDNCNIGMNAVIHQGVTIPEGCMIGMGAVVTKKTKLEPFGVYVGNPAKYLRKNER